jgi:hypothetical protein
MSILDAVQIGAACVALALQISVLVVARPIKNFVSKRLWVLLMCVNVFELARRAMSLGLVTRVFTGPSYQITTVIIGLLISLSLFLFVIKLRKHASKSVSRMNELAVATVELAHKFKAEQSLAYKLAELFIQQRKNRRET